LFNPDLRPLLPGGINITCESLRNYIRSYFLVNAAGRQDRHTLSVEIEGGPAWVHKDRYAVSVKPSGDKPAPPELQAMVRTLLEERFALETHRETRETPVYALRTSKSGLKLPRAKIPCVDRLRPNAARVGETPPRCTSITKDKDGLHVHGVSLADFAYTVSTQIAFVRLDRRVIDQTGIEGQFDFDLNWFKGADEPEPQAGEPADPNRDFIGFVEALHAMGLELVTAKAPVEFLVIDHVERPPKK
jgi:uncharacterized protein (TIGR03435 family)